MPSAHPSGDFSVNFDNLFQLYLANNFTNLDQHLYKLTEQYNANYRTSVSVDDFKSILLEHVLKNGDMKKHIAWLTHRSIKAPIPQSTLWLLYRHTSPDITKSLPHNWLSAYHLAYFIKQAENTKDLEWLIAYSNRYDIDRQFKELDNDSIKLLSERSLSLKDDQTTYLLDKLDKLPKKILYTAFEHNKLHVAADACKLKYKKIHSTFVFCFINMAFEEGIDAVSSCEELFELLEENSLNSTLQTAYQKILDHLAPNHINSLEDAIGIYRLLCNATSSDSAQTKTDESLELFFGEDEYNLSGDIDEQVPCNPQASEKNEALHELFHQKLVTFLIQFIEEKYTELSEKDKDLIHTDIKIVLELLKKYDVPEQDFIKELPLDIYNALQKENHQKEILELKQIATSNIQNKAKITYDEIKQDQFNAPLQVCETVEHHPQKEQEFIIAWATPQEQKLYYLRKIAAHKAQELIEESKTEKVINSKLVAQAYTAFCDSPSSEKCALFRTNPYFSDDKYKGSNFEHLLPELEEQILMMLPWPIHREFPVKPYQANAVALSPATLDQPTAASLAAAHLRMPGMPATPPTTPSK